MIRAEFEEGKGRVIILDPAFYVWREIKTGERRVIEFFHLAVY